MMKCNRSDLNTLADKLGTLQQEICQLTVLLGESLKLNLCRAQDTAKAKQNRTHELMSQVNALATISVKLKAP